MLGFEFAGNFGTIVTLSGLDILLTCCVGAIVVAWVFKKIANRFNV